MGGKVASLEIAAEHKHWDRRSQLREIEAPCVIDRPDPPITARLATHPACRIAYVRLVDPFRGDVLARGYASLTSWLEVRGIEWRQRPLFGMSWDHYDTTPIHRVRFDLGFGVDERVQETDEVGIFELPAVRSVDAHSCGPLRRIAQAWDYLYLDLRLRLRDAPPPRRSQTRSESPLQTETQAPRRRPAGALPGS